MIVAKVANAPVPHGTPDGGQHICEVPSPLVLSALVSPVELHEATRRVFLIGEVARTHEVLEGEAEGQEKAGKGVWGGDALVVLLDCTGEFIGHFHVLEDLLRFLIGGRAFRVVPHVELRVVKGRFSRGQPPQRFDSTYLGMLWALLGLASLDGRRLGLLRLGCRGLGSF